MGDRGWKRTVGEAAVAVTFGFGVAQWVFYGRLGVRPDDVGLGTDEVLVQAAVGAVTILLLAALLGGLALLLSLAVLVIVNAMRATRMPWLETVVAMAMTAAGAGLRWWVLPEGSFYVVCIVALAGYGWVRRRRVDAQEQAPWETAALGGLLWITLLPVGLLLAALARGRSDVDDLGPVMLVSAVIVVVLLAVTTTVAVLRRAIARVDAAELGKGALAVSAGLLAVSTTVTAFNHADVVKSGGTLLGWEQRLVGAPVRCVEPKWIGASESPLPTKYYLFLGAGDQIILYRPRHGPVSVPAGDVVLLPADDAQSCD